jgi:hypothetical protein
MMYFHFNSPWRARPDWTRPSEAAKRGTPDCSRPPGASRKIESATIAMAAFMLIQFFRRVEPAAEMKLV